MMIEQSFPRGGIPAKETKAPISKKDNIIFGAIQTKGKKPKRTKDILAPEDEEDLLLEPQQNDTIESHSAELLNYETVQDGMNIMGMVSSVDPLSLTVSLPGRMIARISALDISEAYTKAAREYLENTENAKDYKTLQELYEIGQLVYGRVQEVRKHSNSTRTEIVMSLKPAEVHADLVHSNIRKGFIFNGAIAEIQEHGYIIESGIKGLRAFLPSEKSLDGLALGQLVFLKVDKITIDVRTSTCSCKQLQADHLSVKPISEANVDYILPTSIVKFEVTKCLKNGLQGTIMNDAFTAYVNEHQLAEPLMLPEDYDIESKHNARILYVMPLTKFVYLTLNLQKRVATDRNEDNEVVSPTFKRGDIIEDARVHRLGTGGVVLILNNNLKGLISYKTMRANYKGNYDQDELLNKYSKKSKHRVRVLSYDLMDSMYICTDDKTIVDEKFFSLDDLKPGEFITAIVKSFNPSIGGYNVEVGKLRGQIEGLYLMPGTKQYEPNTKVRCRVISLNKDRNIVCLTNRAEYMSKNCKLLLSLDAAKLDNDFMGTTVKAGETYYVVRFFNNITGLLYKSQLREGFLNERNVELTEGQTMLFRIAIKSDTKLILRPATQVFELGRVCEAKVTNVLQTALEINVKSKRTKDDEEGEDEVIETKGIIPMHLLSDFGDLIAAKSKIYSLNTELQAVSLYKNIFSVRDVEYFKECGVKSWKNVAIGDVLRAFVENIHDDVIELLIPIHGYRKLVKIHTQMLLMNAVNREYISLEPEQAIYVRVIGKDEETRTISVNAKLNSVWDLKLSSTAEYVESYLSEIAAIRKVFKKKGNPISQFSIGDKIPVVFQSIDEETHHWHYETENSKLPAIAKASIMADGKMKVPAAGAKQEAIVLWIDYSRNLIYISPKKADIKHITNSTNLPEEFSHAQHVNAKILLKLEHIFICSLKKAQNPLVFCPVALHYNDFEQIASVGVKEGEFCKLAFIHKSKPIAVLQQTWDVWNVQENKKRKNSSNAEEKVPNKLRKHSLESKDDPTPATETKGKKKKPLGSDETSAPAKKKPLGGDKTSAPAKKKPLGGDEISAPAKKKPLGSDETSAPAKKKAKIGVKSGESKSDTMEPSNNASTKMFFYEDTTPHVPQEPPQVPRSTKTLAGVNDFWTTDLSKLTDNAAEESSDDDDDADQQNANDASKQKKKRLNAVEKFKQQREEEERLREIEAKYADPNHLPETVDQFDRLVLTDPNNSKSWINYMVFHLQSAEIDKARAVARRAIKAISMRNCEDLLNIWIALLNLEIRYGSRESFDTTLKEALTFNEPIKVYLRVVEIYREANKQPELIEMVGLITKKFKGDQSAWKVAADALFSIGQTEKAQQMLNKSLLSLPEREHVNTIVIFANLNHKHGCKDMAHTLLDEIVTSYPKRVDVWAQYVDMLVKDELIDSARCVLERAILQKIPMKKMRTLFKKFLEFEDKHGTADDVEKVKRLATEYVKNNAHVED